MSVSDPIADLLTCIRNACKAKHKKVDVPSSKMKAELVRVLLREKFINNYKTMDDKRQGILRIYLKYDAKERSVIQGLQRVSKPGRRVYRGATDLRPILNGLGISIISTSRGVISDREARQRNLGGEVLCELW